VRRVAVAATVALDLFLVGAVASWQWLERQPLASVHWQLPILLATFALAAGAVALVACRRANLIVLFLLDFASVLVAAWLFQHLYQRFQLARLAGSG
jgi:hypothetical protein